MVAIILELTWKVSFIGLEPVQKYASILDLFDTVSFYMLNIKHTKLRKRML